MKERDSYGFCIGLFIGGILSLIITLTVLSLFGFFDFLPPEPGSATAQAVGPAQLLSTIDLQRVLNRRYPELKLKEDGVYGPATEAAHVRAIGDQYAKELR